MRLRARLATLLMVLVAACGGDESHTEVGVAARAVFAVFDPPGMRIYSADLNGQNRRVVVSQPLPPDAARSGPFIILDAVL